MFIYNVHAPHKTFALAAKANETCAALIDRAIAKASLLPAEGEAVRAKRDGAGIVYEFDGARWALEDDDDLAIVTERFRSESDGASASSPSITLHINLPSHVNGILRSGPPPSSVSASAQLQQRTERKRTKSSRAGSIAGSVAASSAGAPVSHGSPSVPLSPLAQSRVEHVHYKPPPVDPLTAATHLAVPNSEKYRTHSVGGHSVRSGRSTRSRRSKWGDDDAEPLGDVKRRQWNEFHANNGVRTVVGKVGNVDNVRMLLKSGYRHVYISRSFAVRHRLISSKQTPGFGGYTGLQILGQVPITIGSRTGIHTAMLSEEQHFDVVLGRSWLEKMNIKVDPLDSTILTYMDSGESIPCDLVVLRDAKGDVITIT